MRVFWTATAVLAAGALAWGCGPREEPVMPEAKSAAPAAAPVGPTPEQQQALMAALPAPYNTADLANGQAKFAVCRSCHTVTPDGVNLTGPKLYNIYMTKAAEVPEYSFSDAMKASGLTWDAPTMDKWIADPRAMLPETKMTFLGVKDAKDRVDITAFVLSQRDK